jgi:hypothetical protein
MTLGLGDKVKCTWWWVKASKQLGVFLPSYGLKGVIISMGSALDAVVTVQWSNGEKSLIHGGNLRKLWFGRW